MNLRPANEADGDAIWEIFHAVVATGDTYVFPPDMSRQDALAYWFQAGAHTYVAESDDRIVGTYVLRPNQPALGNHVANAGFMVSPSARGLGVGRAMGEHCLAEARRLGFRAMQFNFVVSTNQPAVRLWQQLGFSIVGTLPGAFRHAQQGYVDAYVMFRPLETDLQVPATGSGDTNSARQPTLTVPPEDNPPSFDAAMRIFSGLSLLGTVIVFALQGVPRRGPEFNAHELLQIFIY